jgi:hypothetical protein
MNVQRNKGTSRHIQIKAQAKQVEFVQGALAAIGLVHRQYLYLCLDALCEPDQAHPLSPVLPHRSANAWGAMRIFTNPELAASEHDQMQIASQAGVWLRQREGSHTVRSTEPSNQVANWIGDNYLKNNHVPSVWHNSPQQLERFAHGRPVLDIVLKCSATQTLYSPADSTPRRKLLGVAGDMTYFRVTVPPTVRARLEALSLKSAQEPLNRLCSYLWLWAQSDTGEVLPTVAAKLAAFSEAARGLPAPRHWSTILLDHKAATEPLADPCKWARGTPAPFPHIALPWNEYQYLRART